MHIHIATLEIIELGFAPPLNIRVMDNLRQEHFLKGAETQTPTAILMMLMATAIQTTIHQINPRHHHQAQPVLDRDAILLQVVRVIQFNVKY